MPIRASPCETQAGTQLGPIARWQSSNARVADAKRHEGNCVFVRETIRLLLIDCPAGIEDGFKNAAAAAREAVVVTTPEVAAVRDADRVIGLLNTQGVTPVQLVLNRVRPKMMSIQEMLSVDDVTDILALPLLGLVFEDEQVIVSTNRGEPLTLGESSSPAAKAYNNIARRLQGEDIPLMDPSEARKGFRARVRQLMQTRLFLNR